MQSSSVVFTGVNRSGPVAMRMAEIVSFSKTISSATIKSYISQELKKPIRLPNNFKPVEISLGVLAKLKTFTYPECLIILANAPDVTKVTSMSAFNVDTVLQGMGYNFTLVNEVDKDLGETLMIGTDGSSFPADNKQGYIKFYDAVGKFFYCPVNGFYINTNYFRDTRIEKTSFNSQLVEAVALVSMFYSLKNGSINQLSSTEAGRDILNFNKILNVAYAQSFDYTADTLMRWFSQLQCPDARGWNAMTLHGLNFAHQLYYTISKLVSADETVIPHLQMIVAKITAPMWRDNMETNFFTVQGDKFVVQGCGLSLPLVLNGQHVKLNLKQASLDQAWYSLHQCRAVRGLDKSEKSALARRTYLDVSVSPNMAEIIYMATNIKRFIDYDNLIVLASPGKSVGTIVEFLNALIMNDYSGYLFLDENASFKNILSPMASGHERGNDVVYRYLAGKFNIILAPVDMMVQATSWISDKKRYLGYVPEEKTLIFDFRIMTTLNYEKKRFSEYNEICCKAIESRIYSYDVLKYSVVTRGPSCTKLFEGFDGVVAVTGVQLHNLEQWICYKCVPDKTVEPWWYVCNLQNMEEICAASIVANIGRTVQAMIRVGPCMLLKRYKFSCPRLFLSGLSRVTSAQIAYSNEEILTAVSQGQAAVITYFNNSGALIQGLMLSDPNIRGQLDDSATERAPTKGIGNTSSGTNHVGMEEDEVFDPAGDINKRD